MIRKFQFHYRPFSKQCVPSFCCSVIAYQLYHQNFTPVESKIHRKSTRFLVGVAWRGIPALGAGTGSPTSHLSKRVEFGRAPARSRALCRPRGGAENTHHRHFITRPTNQVMAMQRSEDMTMEWPLAFGLGKPPTFCTEEVA